MSSPDDGGETGDPIKVGDAGLYGAYMSIKTVAVTCADLPLVDIEPRATPGSDSTGRQSCELNLRCLTVMCPEFFARCRENKEPHE